MHTKIKSTILNVLNDYEVTVKAKLPMDLEFFATLLTVKLYEELQTNNSTSRPARQRKPKEEQEPQQTELGGIKINLPADGEVAR